LVIEKRKMDSMDFACYISRNFTYLDRSSLYPLEVIVGALIGIISAIIIYFTLSKLTLKERNYRLLEKLE